MSKNQKDSAKKKDASQNQSALIPSAKKKKLGEICTDALNEVVKEHEKKKGKIKLDTDSNIPVPVKEPKVAKEKKQKIVAPESTEPKVRKPRTSKFDPAKLEAKFQKALASGALTDFFGAEP